MAYCGKSLRTLRESKHLSLRRIANETRIGVRFLEAIEEERFEVFPGKFYFRSFVREYARVLRISSAHACQDLDDAFDAWSGDAASSEGTAPPQPAPEFWWQKLAAFVRSEEVQSR